MSDEHDRHVELREEIHDLGIGFEMIDRRLLDLAAVQLAIYEASLNRMSVSAALFNDCRDLIENRK